MYVVFGTFSVSLRQIMAAGKASKAKKHNVNPLTDSFDGDRWLVRAKLTGNFHEGAWSFLARVGVIYFEEKQHGYPDSLSIFIPSQTVALGRITFGPKVGYRWTDPDGTTVAPYAAIKGIWDFEKP
jgi:hypothetical protein